MGDFFHGWRRKAGCVTLVMACVVMAMWVRSHNMVDGITFSIGDRHHAIGSMQHGIAWFGWDLIHKDEWGFQSHSVDELGFQSMSLSMIVEEWNRSAQKAEANPNAWAIRYWSIVLPLTLLSAYLILWKPRKRKAESDG
ncbi:MAG: hypothetical protein WCJ09_26925 [Planctomycetota bacterium]